MKHTLTKRVITVILAVAMLLSVVPMTAYASIENWSKNNVVFSGTSFGTNGYYNVISKKDYVLVPGAATETEMVINNAAGTRRQVMHIIEVDPSNPDVSVIPGYYNIDKDMSDVNNWAAAGVTDVAKYYEDVLKYNVVAAMNTDLDYTDNAPRVLVYNGQNLAGYAGASAPKSVLYVWNIDGVISCEVKAYKKADLDAGVANGTLLHAISVSFAMTVNNGELVTKTEERTSSAAARSMVGVKEDGTLVLVMNDGRGANNSVGFCTYELGESMLALGCKWAANCDGGGSSSIVTKRVGETVGTCRCVPCDGAERPTKSSVMVVSNVGPTGELGSVNVESDYDYFAPGTSYTFGAEAIDTHGYAMDMPADAAWALSDASIGTIAADGTFTSNGTLGDVDIQVTVPNTAVAANTVIFTNNKNWSNVKIYAWNRDGEVDTPLTGDWPGVAMAEYDTNEYSQQRYRFDLPEGANMFIINGDDSKQTADLTFTGATGIYIDDNDAAQTYNISTVVVGSKTITVANPESFTLSADSTVLPYSTADKVRKVTLPVVAKVSEADVYLDSTVYSVSLSNPAAGTLSGLTFTATTDESVESTVITVTYLPTEISRTYTVTFGKGSDILWDFEDGDISNWYGGSQDVKVWLTENGVAEADQLKTLISGGQISYSEQSHTFLATKENGGQVHNGNNALGVSFDFRNVEFNSWVYALLYNIQDQYVLRDVANGKKATALGMWCYVPEGFCNPAGDTSGALAMQLTVYKNPQGTSGGQLNFQFYSEAQKKRVSLNQCTEADIPANRWVYLTADLTGSNYISLTNPKGTSYREPSFFRMYIKPTRAQVLTYYFDDFTLDYSSAVDDRDAPVITNPTYCTNDENIAFANQTVTSNVLAFNANIAEYAASNAEGLDYSTAAIYADGVKQTGVTASGNTMGVKDVVLSDGTHTIKFEIYDNAGNFTSIEREITVSTGSSKSVVTLQGHNDLNNVPESDSLYYADLVASDIAQINSITATLKLNTANTWELDHMIPAKGFKATYAYNEISKLATVTVEKIADTDLTGEQTLVSIPARVWAFDESTDVGGDGTASTYMTREQRFNSSYGEPKVFVDVKVVSGAINYTDKTSATFGGNFSVATKMVGNKSGGMWHAHDTELTPLEKDATCLEDGYTGRTYCETCGSVVDWGTTIPATGHDYQLNTSTKQFVCSHCDDVLDISGITGTFEVNGKYYAAIGGNLVNGWQLFEDGYYFFNPATYTSQSTFSNGKVTFSFAENGKLISGEWYYDGEGMMYYYGPDYYRCTAGNPYANVLWVEIDGATYGFDKAGHRHEGIRLIIESNKDGELFEFDSEGKLIGAYETDITGLFFTNGQLCYLEDGVPSAAGLVLVDGYYYYFNSSFTAVKGRYNVTRPNGLVPGGEYEFDDDYKMKARHGVFDGKLYVNGVMERCYQLINFEGDWYFINDGDRVAKSTTLYLSQKFVDGTPLVPGYYEFDAEGKIILREGFQEDGTLWINGVQQRCYQLLNYQGDWYFISDGNKPAKNTRVYLSQQFVEGTDFIVGYYEFDVDGKMVIKNGPQEDGFFYINGAKLSCYQLVNYEDNYYFISDGHKYAKSARIYLSQQFIEGTPFTPAYYDFLEDGTLDMKNGPLADGYFYENGVRLNAYQLVEYEGYYYFIDDGNKYAKNKRVYLSQQFLDGTDLVPAYYDFLEDGKLDMKQGPKEDGYFYQNGVRLNAYQLIEYDEKYYFIDDGNKYAKNKRVYLSQQFLDGTDLVPAYYDFLEDGTLDMKEGPLADGYIYHNGVRLNAYQLLEIDGYWYFIDDGNKYAKNKRIYLSQQFVEGTDFTVGYYEFDNDGKLVIKNGPWDDDFFYLNSVRQNAYQLIKYDEKYYFISDGNKYAKNQKLYLNAIFIGEEPLEVGYYQFGADGSMQGLKYYTNSQNEVVADLGMIFEDGEYYYVRTTGQLAIGNYKIDHTKTNDFLKGDKTFSFDENGVMTVPDYYIKSIRDGRDVGVFMAERNATGINGRALKTGTLLRGGEIDGAINPYTNQPDAEYVKQYAIDTLKNTYGVTLDMDLRYDEQVALSGMGITHPLGNDVTHKFYDMVLYDYVFTADGMAKIKAIFDDLAAAEGPVYIHCTWGLDRTGIVCFLLEGVLGVDEWSSVVDYCTTKGSDQPSIEKVRKGIKDNYSGATYTIKVENFLKSCGITDDQITAIRNNFLEAAE